MAVLSSPPSSCPSLGLGRRGNVGCDVGLEQHLGSHCLTTHPAVKENGEEAALKRHTFIIDLYKELQDPVLVRDQLVHVLIAGRDTTACLISWTFFLLVRHPNVLARLRDEIHLVTGGDSRLNRVRISQMKYLRCVINECQRLYPQLPTNVRVAARTTVIPHGGGPDGKSPVLIPKGTGVGYSVYHMHRLKSLYGEDADHFRPERWLGSALDSIGWGFMPFHGGPRMCLGQEFALTEASYAITRIIQAFPRLRLPPQTLTVPPGEEKQDLTVVVISAEGCKWGALDLNNATTLALAAGIVLSLVVGRAIFRNSPWASAPLKNHATMEQGGASLIKQTKTAVNRLDPSSLPVVLSILVSRAVSPLAQVLRLEDTSPSKQPVSDPNGGIAAQRVHSKRTGRWLLENQIELSAACIAVCLFTHYSVPDARSYTSKFLFISHYSTSRGTYAAGGDDFYFIAFCIVLFTGLRAAVMKYILAPLATFWGISRKKDVNRFAEQGWLLCYYSILWTLGMYIYYTSSYFLDLREMWTDWPTRDLPAINKAYVLCQWAFWLQQVLVIHIEQRRKDHWQMLAHHTVAIVLISTSYAWHLTRVANLILILMDVVDILFSLAKCLKYLGLFTLCDIMFGVFMVSWFIARHVLYLTTMWSIYTHMAEIIPIGCFHGSQDALTGPTPLPERGLSHMLDPFRNPSGTICFSPRVQWGFLVALGFLQFLNLVWLVMIVRVALRVLAGRGADDVRSEDEGEYDGEWEMTGNGRRGGASSRPEGLGVATGLKASQRITNTKRTAHSTGVGLPRRSDQKQLLGRLGCDRQID
ncbi:longevity assurance proteins LAG1/LAC1 [Aspergillus affinis]|uniref:longevity assurance proteins LAG1/LAC1 n=1 Tax=Aspergillus affinis TaxID=1070780 RepID=UPI0022FE634F|nr:longevity assurance proteins LAG1/LAC1 [Aspergillus affinis]KAI9042411.1 longevity assurance proteins LAG1/LAC1 [Aspergillus affinis]